MTAQTAADLRAAAEVLRRDGWTQGCLQPKGLCAIEAIWRACDQVGGHPSQLAVEQLRTVIPAPQFIADWNDTPGRTADEVIAALEAAADAAERKAAYDEGRWCGECVYGVVMDPPCCTQGPVQP